MTADGHVASARQLHPRSTAAPVGAQIVLLGAGQVGRALLARLAENAAARDVRLVGLADSRRSLVDAGGIPAADAFEALTDARRSSAIDPVSAFGRGARCRIVVDATASEIVAARHAHWLSCGIHVVTANKLGLGGPLARWRAIGAACARSGARYGDSATVGAGLPLLRTLRELRAGGDAILEIAGVLSGTLAWLFDRYDGDRPFSACVHEARALGYTEPDPRTDLSGEDVRRKLLILARAASIELDVNDVRVEPLLAFSPATAADSIDAELARIDAPLREHFAAAQRAGLRLCYVARFDADGRPRVGLDALPPEHPIACGGCDNRIAIRSSRYDARPLLIRGPGAGADVTAAALLDDVLRITASAG